MKGIELLCLLGFSLVVNIAAKRPRRKTAIGCEGTDLRFACKDGWVIKLYTANYGRTDGTTCNGPYTNQNCTTPWAKDVILSYGCEGQQSCVVPAVDSVFGDPCPGTGKYLDVSYRCVSKRSKIPKSGWKQHHAIACTTGEDGIEPVTLRCEAPGTKIELNWANWGRLSSSICPNQDIDNKRCLTPWTKEILAASGCEGYQQCTMPSETTRYGYGEPCDGTRKYLEAKYRCVPCDSTCSPMNQVVMPPGNFCKVIVIDGAIADPTINGIYVFEGIYEYGWQVFKMLTREYLLQVIDLGDNHLTYAIIKPIEGEIYITLARPEDTNGEVEYPTHLNDRKWIFPQQGNATDILFVTCGDPSNVTAK